MNSENLDSFVISDPTDIEGTLVLPTSPSGDGTLVLPTSPSGDDRLVLPTLHGDDDTLVLPILRGGDDRLIQSQTKRIYNLSLRKKIAERVESLKSKKHFKQIFKLIHSSCPNSYTRDGTGVYINFEVIPNEAIEKVENYLNEVSPKTSFIPLPAKYTPYFSDEFNPKDSGIKLSNHEKNFLKYIGNDSETKNTYEPTNTFDTESSMCVTSESNSTKTKIIIKPFTFE